MKRIFWIFTIRGKIRRRIENLVYEENYFIKQLQETNPDGNQTRYLNSRIEMKRESVDLMKSLL